MEKGSFYNLRRHLYERPFRKLTMDDRKWVEKACREDAGIGGYVNFYCLMLSQEMYEFDIYRKKWGCIVKHPWAEDGKLYVQYPIGSPANRKKAVKKIVEIYADRYEEIVFFAASDENLAELQNLYGDFVTNVENKREYQEYMLDAEEQILLEGSQFSSRRNKIRRFEKLNNWSYEEITRDNLAECAQMAAEWYGAHEKSEDAVGEQVAFDYTYAHYDDFDFQGGILRVDGRAAAFHIGAPFNKEIYMCLFLKSRKEYRDAPIVLLHEFMKRNCAGYRYINYSEDLGIEGLRLFKMNLRPKFFTPFYYVTLKVQR